MYLSRYFFTQVFVYLFLFHNIIGLKHGNISVDNVLYIAHSWEQIYDWEEPGGVGANT
jgi:hypothetical protein